MTRQISIAIMALFMACLTAKAEIASGECGTNGNNLTWVLNDDGTVIVSGDGDMMDYSSADNTPWCSYRSKIKSLYISKGVTSIGQYAFCACDNLTEVTTSGQVETIESYAFRMCSSLQTVMLGNNVKEINSFAFDECKNMEYINFPNSLEKIGDYAFTSCKKLTSVVIPKNVKTIGKAIFRGCDNLKSLTVDGNNKTFDSRENCNAVIRTSTNKLIATCRSSTIPSTVTCIGEGAFEMQAIYSINFPNSVQTIEDWCFWLCDNLNNVTIGTGLQNIGQNGFSCCYNLKNVTCYATVPPTVVNGAFEQTRISSGTLTVPGANMDAYKSVSPWNTFLNYASLPEACATPDISYTNGHFTFSCTTEGATITKSVSSSYNSENGNVTLTATAYATCDGFSQSETATLNVDLSNDGTNIYDVNRDGVVNIVDVSKVVSNILKQ